MLIELVKIGAPNKVGNNTRMEVEYVRDGKSVKRALVSIGKTAQVIQELGQMVTPSFVEIDLEKSESNGKTFYNWVGIKKLAARAVAAVAEPVQRTSYQAKSTYETPEERAKKQVYIVRQSSIANAIEFLGQQKGKFTVRETLDLASQFASFVFATEGQQTVDEVNPAPVKDDFKDDVPF